MEVSLMFQVLIVFLLSTAILKLADAKRRRNEEDDQNNDFSAAWEMEECQGAFRQYRAELNRALYFKVPRDKDCVLQKIKREGCQLYVEKLEEASAKSGDPLDIHAKCPHRAYERDNLNLYCGDGEVINVMSAFFGNKTVRCSGDPERDLARVQQRCNGFPGCSVYASVSIFGDPCSDTPKYLEVDYKCEAVQPPSRDLRFSLRYYTCASLFIGMDGFIKWIRASPTLLEKKFGAIKSTSLSGEELFFGRKTKWDGVEECGQIYPSTRTLHTSKADIKGTREFEILVFRNGTRESEIRAFQNGIRVATSGVLCTALEREGLRMKCDQGKLINVSMVFWGNRERFCPGKKTDLHILQTLCNHKLDCDFEANSDLFGNPCRDVIKYLEFKFECLNEEGSIPQGTPWKWVDFTPELRKSGPPATAVRVGVEGSFNAFVCRKFDQGNIYIARVLIAVNNATDIVTHFYDDRTHFQTRKFQILTDPRGRLQWVKASANLSLSAKVFAVTVKTTVNGKEFPIGRHLRDGEFYVGASPSNSDVLVYNWGDEVLPTQNVVCTAFEGHRMWVNCDEGGLIHVSMSFWGHRKRSCPGKNSELFILQTLCNHKSNCDFEASKNWFGDPCKEISGIYLEFKFECLKEEAFPQGTSWEWVGFTPELRKSGPPATAVRVGVEGSFNVFVGRAIDSGKIYIGKILIAVNNATDIHPNFPIDWWKEAQRNFFQILTDPGGRLHWVKASANSSAKSFAVTVKNTVVGKEVPIGRHVRDGAFVVGLSPFDSDSLVYYWGNEGPKKTKDFEILIAVKQSVVGKPDELIHVNENEVMNLVCGGGDEDGAVINVLFAFYRKPETKECHAKPPEMDLSIVQKCNGKRTCSVLAYFDVVGSPCDQKKSLELKYKCLTGVVHRIGEKDPAQTLACTNGVIRLTSAFYGNREKTCGGKDGKGDLIRLQYMCDGMEKCSVESSNNVFGDPCYGIEKYLEYSYVCLSVSGALNPWKWVECARSKCSFGSTAVKVGTEGDKTIYVARGYKDGQILIGRIIEEHSENARDGVTALFPMGEETEMDTFQLLHDPHKNLEWVKSSSSGLKPNTIKRAVVGGLTKGGEHILIGRTQKETALICGQVLAGSSTLTYAWSKEVNTKEFHVLVVKEPSLEN